MGNFLEEITNGNLGDILGSILGGGGESSGGGGLEDIIESMRKKMGGEVSPADAEEPVSSGGGGLSDIVKEIRKKMGGGDDVATTNDSNDDWIDNDKSDDIVKELRKKRGLDPDGPSSTSDVVKEMRKKSGLDTNEQKKSSSDVFKELDEKIDEPAEEQQADEGGIGGLGDIGDIFKKLGIDPSNLGGLAESVLKTIGLAGNAI